MPVNNVPAIQQIDARRAARRVFAPRDMRDPDKLLEEPLPPHRTADLGRVQHCYGPAAGMDGKVRLFDTRHTITVDAASFQVEQKLPLSEKHPHGDFLPPAFAADGTSYYTVYKNQYWAAAHPPRIRGVRDGVEVLNVEAGGTVTSPIVLGPQGNLVYATDAGRVEVKDPRDGHALASVPVMPPVTQSSKAHIDVAVQTPQASVLAQTTDNWLLHVSQQGQLLWGVELPYEVRGIPPVLSADGGTVFVSGVRGHFVALDTKSGEEKWTHAYSGHSVSTPQLDADGNVYTYTSSGNVHKWSAQGQPLDTIDTGAQVYVGGGRNFDRLALDRHNDICVQAGSNHFLVFDTDGVKLQDVECTRLYGKSGDFYHGFTLSPEKDKAYLLDHYQNLAEVMLPYPSQHEEARIVSTDDVITIGSVKVPRRRASQVGTAVSR